MKQKVRLTESQLNRIIRNCINEALDEEELDEGWWDGVKNVGSRIANNVKNAYNGTQPKRLNGEKKASWGDTFTNGNKAGEISKAVNTLNDSMPYLQKIGVNTNSLGQILSQIEGAMENLKQGGVSAQRDSNGRIVKGSKFQNYNYN